MSRRGARAAAGLAFVVLAFAFLGSRGLWEPDEGRYASVAARMLRTGDWLVPALDDETPHFSKPPLTYWVVAASRAALGANEWAARLPNALAWLLTIWLVHGVAGALGARSPALCAGIQATFPLPYLGATMVTTDTLLVAFETLAVLGFVRWWRGPGASGGSDGWGSRMVLWTGLGLAFLTKGPVGLLPLLVMLAALATTTPRRLPALFHPAGLACFLVIGGGWYAWVLAERPELLDYFLREELWGRAVQGRFDRHPEWYGPLRIYAPALVLGALPWSPLAFLRARRWLRALGPSERPPLRARDPEAWFLLLWLLLPLAVLCLVRSRLPLYVLPLFPPLALLLARLVDPGALRTDLARSLLVGWVVTLVGLRAVAGQVPAESDARPLARAVAALDHSPGVLVFVDVDPMRSLGFYLDADVEAVAATEPPDGRRTLDEEVQRARPGRLFVIPRYVVPDFKRIVRAVDHEYDKLGAFDHSVFMITAPKDRRGRRRGASDP